MPTIYEDTRQQAGKHNGKHAWWSSHGIEIVRKKLDFGDYMTDASNVSVDTKRSIMEVAANVGRDHDRVVREVERARQEGYRLIFLIEASSGSKPYECVEDLATWTNQACRRCIHYRTSVCTPSEVHRFRCIAGHPKPIQGGTMVKIMRAMEREHGCVFEFCAPAGSARRICELLGVDHGR